MSEAIFSTRHNHRTAGCVVAALLLLLAGSPGSSAVRQPFVRLDGSLVLSQSSVQAIAQDRDGYLWIGTQAGLDRYDGYRIDSWHTDRDDPSTLSDGFIKDILVARDNTLWVGTRHGLDRLEPHTRSVTRMSLQLVDGTRTDAPIRPGSLIEDKNGDLYALRDNPPAVLRWRPGHRALSEVPVDGAPATGVHAGATSTLVRDRAGRIWLGHAGGLWRLNRATDRFEPVLTPRRQAGGDWSTLGILAVGPGDGVTYASADGLYRIEPGTAREVRLLRPTRHGLAGDWVRAVGIDSRGAVWFTQPGKLVRVDPATGTWQTFDQPRLDPDVTANSGHHALWIAETPNGDIWLAGLLGLARYDPATGRLETYRHDPNDPASPPPTLGEIGYRIFVDRFGVLWVGGNLGGLARVPPHGQRFIHVADRAESPTSRNIIRAIAEQRVGDDIYVWSAAQNHGITVWRQTGERDFTPAHRYPSDGPIAKIGVVRDFAIDPVDGSVWIAGERGLGRIRRAGDPLEFPASGVRPVSHALRAAEFIDDHTLLVSGSIREGPEIWRIDTRSKKLEAIDARLPQAIGAGSTPIFDLAARRNGTLVAATGLGLAVIETATGATRWHFPARRPGVRSGNQLFTLAAGGRGRWWAGTRGSGLLHIEFVTERQPVFRRVAARDALPDDTVYALLPDDRGALWLSTNRGVARFNPATGEVRRYTPGDGLQAWEFNHTVAHRGQSGRFYFGGINGWNAFRPAQVRPLMQPPEIDLVAVRVGERSVRPDAGGRLDPLPHDDNRLTIDYVGLHFAAPERIRYAYRLTGLDRDWVDAGANRRARYPDLGPGRYRFEVRARNLDGVWSQPEALLEFSVRRAPWATPWAWALYSAALALGVLAYLARQRQIRRRLEARVEQRTAQVREQKNLMARQARELEQALAARTTLFASISHEFRTPLTLIRAGIDRLERGPDPDAVATARRYVARLLRLVEQLLDLSSLGLTRSAGRQPPWRLDSVVAQTVEAFRSVAEHRGLSIDCRITSAWQTSCPQDLVEKILLNLIGNAVKFTPAGGRITVGLEPTRRGVGLSVRDTGPGIPESEQERIFERFYRAGSDRSEHQPGAGVGLALVFEAARAAGGDVRVDSRPGHGACFTVTLPAEPDAGSSQAAPPDRQRQILDLEMLDPRSHEAPRSEPSKAPPSQAGTVLVVEDSADLRRYLVDELSAHWRVIEAADGEAGIASAIEHDCDLIVSDLMMPGVDGFEMLERLRSDIRTSHIPVLFLTARQDDETRLRAFTLSADGFLPKPFDPDELRARLDQMIRQRERLRNHIHRTHAAGPSGRDRDTPGPKPHEGALSTRDRELLASLDAWLESHHGDPDLTIEAMAASLHITTRTLQRKLRSLADRTPATYLRDYRMARARAWLRDTDRPVTEVAFGVGYASSQYFSRVFGQLHGEAPERWRRRQRGTAEAQNQPD